MQILLYDDKEMHIFDVANYEPKNGGFNEVDASCIEDVFWQRVILPKFTYDVEVTIGEVKAKLDPTTMKRIAKHNLDKDFEELNRKISEAEERLKFLEGEVKLKENKLNFMWKVCQEIWKDKDFEEEKYMPDDGDYYEF